MQIDPRRISGIVFRRRSVNATIDSKDGKLADWLHLLSEERPQNTKVKLDVPCEEDKHEEDKSKQVKSEENRSEEDNEAGYRGGIYEFANWAFSADGLPNLQVVVSGDFSVTCHRDASPILLCKSDIPGGCQALMTPAQGAYWDLVQDNMDMLTACPFVDDII